MSSYSTSKEPDGASPGLRRVRGLLTIARGVIWGLFLPFALLSRLGKDERRRVKFNTYLPEPQRVSPSRDRIKLMAVAAGLSVVQLMSLAAVVLGAGTTGAGPRYAISRALARVRLPKFTDIVNPVWFAILLVAAVIAAAVWWATFKRKNSRHAQFFSVWEKKNDGRDGKEMGVLPPWYYAGKILFMDMVDRTGEEAMNDNAFWNRVNFKPGDFCRIPGTNQHLFMAAVDKPSNSTFLYDRYDEWTALVQDKMKLYSWQLGEYVNRNEFMWKSAFEDFSILFVGQSGSGKTEAMKSWLSNFLCKHPQTHFVLCDLKKTGDWDVFSPLTECAKIVKSTEETLLAITYFEDLLNARTDYMQKKGYKDIRAWSEQEGIVVPPVLLIIDEFPQMNGPLKWDVYSRRDATTANVLFKLYTTGRSFGLWVILGSQFSGADAVPSEMNKNIKVHVTLRTGSEGESMQWINAPDAFWIGKNIRRSDGSEDRQVGYAYIDGKTAYVRFWYSDDWLIVHEFLKYGVPTMVGSDHAKPRKMSIPMGIRDRLKLVDGNRKKLSEREQKELAANEAAQIRFEASYSELAKAPNPGLETKKEPLGLLWEVDEPVDKYFERCRRERGAKLPASAATSGSAPGVYGGLSRHAPPPVPLRAGDVGSAPPGDRKEPGPAVGATLKAFEAQEEEFEAMIERRRKVRGAAIERLGGEKSKKRGARSPEVDPDGEDPGVRKASSGARAAPRTKPKGQTKA